MKASGVTAAVDEAWDETWEEVSAADVHSIGIDATQIDTSSLRVVDGALETRPSTVGSEAKPAAGTSSALDLDRVAAAPEFGVVSDTLAMAPPFPAENLVEGMTVPKHTTDIPSAPLEVGKADVLLRSAVSTEAAQLLPLDANQSDQALIKVATGGYPAASMRTEEAAPETSNGLPVPGNPASTIRNSTSAAVHFFDLSSAEAQHAVTSALIAQQSFASSLLDHTHTQLQKSPKDAMTLVLGYITVASITAAVGPVLLLLALADFIRKQSTQFEMPAMTQQAVLLLTVAVLLVTGILPSLPLLTCAAVGLFMCHLNGGWDDTLHALGVVREPGSKHVQLAEDVDEATLPTVSCSLATAPSAAMPTVTGNTTASSRQFMVSAQPT